MLSINFSPLLTNATKLRYHKNMNQLENITSLLRQYRLRATKTRKVVLHLFFRDHTPLSVSRILDELEAQSVQVNKTTVYRELETLEALGIIKSLTLQDRKQYFELATREHHHHFVCTVCQQITDVEIDEEGILERAERLGRKLGFHITNHAVEFYGQCATCLTSFPSAKAV